MRHQLFFFFVVGLVCGAGCGGGGSEDPAGSSTGSQTEGTPTDETPHATTARTDVPHAADVAPAANAPAAPTTAPGETRLDAHGIVVTRKADGTIHVEGTDRWGARMDITYADGHYYKHAVDVLGLSVTPEQARALEESVQTIAPEAVHDRAPPQTAGAPAGR